MKDHASWSAQALATIEQKVSVRENVAADSGGKDPSSFSVRWVNPRKERFLVDDWVSSVMVSVWSLRLAIARVLHCLEPRVLCFPFLSPREWQDQAQ